MEVEIWKDIPDYDGYQVSNFGNVKSFKKNKNTLLTKTIKGDYQTVRLYGIGSTKDFSIHILVAIMFKGHTPSGSTKGLVVDHIDNNPLNNRADNLQLIPHRENCSKDKKGYTSKFAGVYFRKDRGTWQARITFNYRAISLGCFILEIDAANAYQKALGELNDGLNLDILYPKKINNKYDGIIKHGNKWLSMYEGNVIGRFYTKIEAYEFRNNYINKA
jgi:hypothetical protein